MDIFETRVAVKVSRNGIPTYIRSMCRNAIPTYVVLLLFSGCQKLSTIPTSEDNFIIVPPSNLGVVYAANASILIAWDP